MNDAIQQDGMTPRDNSLLLSREIYRLLTKHPGLAQFLEKDHIFPIRGLFQKIDETNFPFLTYRKTGVTPFYTKDGPSYNVVSVEINVCDDDYDRLQDVANMVRDALECVRTREGERTTQIAASEMTGASEEWDDCYVFSLSFEFTCG